jgi:hypothetical protein
MSRDLIILGINKHIETEWVKFQGWLGKPDNVHTPYHQSFWNSEVTESGTFISRLLGFIQPQWCTENCTE